MLTTLVADYPGLSPTLYRELTGKSFTPLAKSSITWLDIALISDVEYSENMCMSKASIAEVRRLMDEIGLPLAIRAYRRARSAKIQASKRDYNADMLWAITASYNACKKLIKNLGFEPAPLPHA